MLWRAMPKIRSSPRKLHRSKAALKICDKAYVMKTGHIVLSGTGEELLADVEVRKAYVGERGSNL